jgi:hypothetical protein
VSKPFTGNLYEEGRRAAEEHVRLGCPEARLHVDVPVKVRETGSRSSGVVVHSVPVYVVLPGERIHLEPGRRATVNVTVGPGCIVFTEKPSLRVQLRPVEGGLVLDIRETRVSVAGG